MEKFAIAYYYVFKNTKSEFIDSNVLLQMLCDELDVCVTLQRYNLLNKHNAGTESRGLLVFLSDKKYDYNVIAFSDVNIESLIMGKNDMPSFNLFLVPLNYVDSINLNMFDENFRISAIQNPGLFYSNSEKNADIIDIAKKLNVTERDIIKVKNNDFLSADKFGVLMKNVSRVMEFDHKQVISNRDKSKSLFFASAKGVEDSRIKIKEAASQMIDIQIIKDSQNSTFDCASFVTFLFMSELGIDITKNGIGKSLTGKIMSSDIGKNYLIDEDKSLQEKYDFAVNNASVGDVLFFHRQSTKCDLVTEDNWFPGHVGVYIGNGKYIDARHRRGNVQVVDMKNDLYMDCFIGIKKIIDDKSLIFEQRQNGEG